MRHYGRQRIEDDDIEAVVEVLKSDFLTTGPQVAAFEEEFASRLGAKYAVAVSSGTAALHVAMLALEIGEGDRVVTSANSFLASANCAAFVGATPDFCDIDPVSYNICPEALRSGWLPDTKAVVAVDYAGQPANMPAVAEVARENGAYVIEDACHGAGTSFIYEGERYHVGGHPWADLTVFSFHPVKTITAGEGGMIMTDDAKLAERLRLFRNHGMTKNQADFSDAIDVLNEKGPWYYEMHELGYNYRITDIQCALARSQLRKLDQFMSRRSEIVEKYNKVFMDVAWMKTPRLCGWLVDTTIRDISWHLYTLWIDFDAIGLSRTDVMKHLSDKSIGTQVLYIPIYLQPWYRKKFGYCQGKCPNAEAFYRGALSLPLHPSLSEDDVLFVVESLKALV